MPAPGAHRQPRLPAAILLALLLLVAFARCSGCDYIKVEAPPAACQGDLDCFIARARTCTPASVTHRSVASDGGTNTPTVMRYEIIGKVGSRCHLRRTQLEPALSPIEEPFKETLKPRYQPDPAKQNPHLLQCLYSNSQAVAALQHLHRQGQLSPADLELCYPGDGSCGRVPLLAPGCVLGDCLLGRWTFTCEDENGKNIQRCEGPRPSDRRPHCPCLCKNGKVELDCWEPPPP